MKALLALLLAWLSGLTLHPATGPAVPVPLPADHAATVRLLGPASGGGWVLADERGDRKVVLRLRGHRLSTIRSIADPLDGASFLLATDGRRVAEVDAPTTVRTDVYAYGVSGGQVRHRSFRGYWELLGYDGETMWLTNGHRTWAWTPGGSAVETVGFGGVAAAPEHDLLFVFDGAGVGPTSLSSPAAPSWSLPASDFYPERVSPDGAYVAGAGSRRNSLQVRRVSDGSLVSEWSVHLAYDRPLAWDGHRSNRLVSVLRTRRGWAVLHCHVGGECARATPLVGDPISLPDQLTVPGLP